LFFLYAGFTGAFSILIGWTDQRNNILAGVVMVGIALLAAASLRGGRLCPGTQDTPEPILQSGDDSEKNAGCCGYLFMEVPWQGIPWTGKIFLLNFRLSFCSSFRHEHRGRVTAGGEDLRGVPPGRRSDSPHYRPRWPRHVHDYDLCGQCSQSCGIFFR
jgi:hypothetical protein